MRLAEVSEHEGNFHQAIEYLHRIRPMLRSDAEREAIERQIQRLENGPLRRDVSNSTRSEQSVTEPGNGL
jgi:hypothetical protein